MPPDFESEWRPTMDMWGHKMLDATTAVAAMAAEGFGLQPDAFTKMMQVRQAASQARRVGKRHRGHTDPTSQRVPQIGTWGQTRCLTELYQHHPTLALTCVCLGLQNGPHLLAPTGSDFERFGKLDTVLAG